MADIVCKEVRSKMMSGIRAKNTKPELIIRKGLFAKGLRYRLHDKKLPGKPDLVFPKFRVVLFVNGCFWHGHACDLFKIPSTNSDFWKNKIGTNQANDEKNKELLLAAGWRVVTIWECAIKGKRRLDFNTLISSVEVLIRNNHEEVSSELMHQ